MAAQTPTERLGNLGYGALIKETTPGTPLTPNVFFPLYKSTLNTDIHLDKDNPIMGVKTNPFNAFMGLRTHGGDLDVPAEPNTAKYFLDMLLAIGAKSGGGPYTWPFTEGNSNSYTLDQLKGQVVERYWGVMAESIEINFDKNLMKFKIVVAARGSFISRQITSLVTTALLLDTAYDPVPTKGLVVGDLVRILKADNSNYLDTTIASINADGVHVTLNDSAAAFGAGDLIFLRAQTPSYNVLTPFFQLARTETRFGASASAALSATHTPQEKDKFKWKLTNKFNNKDGDHRTGSFDPQSIVRLQTEAEVSLKKFFDQPTDYQNFLNIAQNNALVVRHFLTSGGNSYELRLTFDQLYYETHVRDFDSGKIIYADIKAFPVYNSSNGEGFSVSLINNLSA